MKTKEKLKKRKSRVKRVRSKIKGTSKIPRLSVFRSRRHIYTQLIDDEKRRTILSANDFDLKELKKIPQKEENLIKRRKVKIAYQVGYLLAKRALKKNVKRVVFDRGPYKYHGRVRALAEGARIGGLNF